MKKSTDARKIANRLGLEEKDIQLIKGYLFGGTKYWNELTEQMEEFEPDAAIAQSWQRLAESKKILKHDETLIKHEMFEMQIKEENPGIDHVVAHRMAEKKYNYAKEADEYYARIKKRKKR